jgi:hypothetical protein
MSAQFKYRDLLAQLQAMTPEQLNCDVTLIDCNDELCPGVLDIWNDGDWPLDMGHPIIRITNDMELYVRD